jgi:hypothetical protein
MSSTHFNNGKNQLKEYLVLQKLTPQIKAFICRTILVKLTCFFKFLFPFFSSFAFPREGLHSAYINSEGKRESSFPSIHKISFVSSQYLQVDG